MKVRRTLTVIVGLVQSMIAVLTVIFAFILYFNLFDIQTWFNDAVEFHHLHVFALFVFGFFSIISGLFLVHEWLKSR